MKKCFVLIILTVLAFNVFATNGMSMIGYGPRSSSMGGASLGILDDVNSINTNPGAISFINNRELAVSLGLLLPTVTFKNDLNDVEGESEIFPMPNISYVHGTEDKLTFGFGFYTQGGMGASYEGMKHNIFRNYDYNPQTIDALQDDLEYHSMIAYMKVMPTVAYKLTDCLSVGFTPSYGYAMLEMQMPYSLPPSAMAGVINPENGMTFGDMFGGPMEQGGLGYTEVTAYADMGDAATAYGYGAKIGASYKLNEKLSFGLAYNLASTLTFEGEASMDMTAQFGDAFERMVYGGLMQMGIEDISTATMEQIQMVSGGVMEQLGMMGIDMTLGMIADYDVEIEMIWPQDLGFGVAFMATDALTIAADVRWINWKDSMEEFKMKFTDGTNANINAMMGSEDMELSMPMLWDDQIVIALGLDYAMNDRLNLRGGFNYANNPVPAKTIIPIFPAVVENHITLGGGYKVTEQITLDLGYELNLETEVEAEQSIIANEYNNSTSTLAENIIHIGLGYKF